MYNLVNTNIDKILVVIDRDKDIKPYVNLVRKFREVNVSTDYEFQSVYRKYWQLNAARLNDGFCAFYFDLLEKSKRAENVSVQEVAQWLYKIPTHADGRHSLQFSFATKFVHMINHKLPIYDSMVEAFYFFPMSSYNESKDKKLERQMKAYNFLCEEYERILQHGLLKYSIEKFRLKFGDLCQEYTDNKIIDTIIWRFVGFMRNGAVTNKDVIYN